MKRVGFLAVGAGLISLVACGDSGPSNDLIEQQLNAAAQRDELYLGTYTVKSADCTKSERRQFGEDWDCDVVANDGEVDWNVVLHIGQFPDKSWNAVIVDMVFNP